jgi:hypothetical protein
MMTTEAPMDFHRRALAIFRATPAPMTESETALATLARREAALGLTLPAAVRAWYAIDGASELLRRGLDAQGIALEELGAPYEGLAEEPIDLVPSGWLLVLVENQGVCSWAVRLDGSDDPPVDVELDSMPEPEWQPFAATFSAFVEHCACWTARADHPLAVSGVASPEVWARAQSALAETIPGAWALTLETPDGPLRHAVAGDAVVSYVAHEHGWSASGPTPDALNALLDVLLVHLPTDRLRPANEATTRALAARH